MFFFFFEASYSFLFLFLFFNPSQDMTPDNFYGKGHPHVQYQVAIVQNMCLRLTVACLTLSDSFDLL